MRRQLIRDAKIVTPDRVIDSGFVAVIDGIISRVSDRAIGGDFEAVVTAGY